MTTNGLVCETCGVPSDGDAGPARCATVRDQCVREAGHPGSHWFDGEVALRATPHGPAEGLRAALEEIASKYSHHSQDTGDCACAGCIARRALVLGGADGAARALVDGWQDQVRAEVERMRGEEGDG
jgi:hypothetical protein